jgi:HD-GYP domain-containing protein (c-di-GMP phosphodiesterase class II)
MQRIPIEEVKQGMKLAKPIFRVGDGHILLQENIELKQSYIERIKLLNYSHVYIQDPQADSPVITSEPIKEMTRAKAVVYLKGVIRDLKSTERIDVQKLVIVVKEAIEQILSDSYVVYNLIKMRACDNYLFNHSVNVSVLSLLIGSAMGLDRNDLESLGMGAMLHDIGKVTITEKILNKISKLEPAEYEMVKKHARYGYEILKNKINTTFIIAHVAFQHHEREDGSGYPRGLVGKEIHRFAKIVAVADVFDAMTTARPFQKEVQPYIALKEINNLKFVKYDSYVVQNLTKVVAPYPLGSVLLLNNGQNVAVTCVTRNKCLVKVTQGPHEGKIYNLFQTPELKVITQIG